jgi:AbrB family looped-hinge helix DNA binding protein
MASATLKSNGQITIPTQVMNALGVEPGDRICFVEMEGGRFVIEATKGSVRRLKGLIRKPTSPVSIARMNPYK